MRWEDERYVRLYTRNTPEWLALSWQARGLIGLVLRELDRAGIMTVGKLGLKGVAVAITAPWAEVERPLNELLEDGCLCFDAEQGKVWMPNYMEAQEAVQSDAARKRASRERAKAQLSEPDPTGHVYFVRSTASGRIKIGFSTLWESRIRGMQTDHGAPLEVLLVIDGRKSLERALHVQLEAHRVDGEWFTDHDAVRAEISRRRDADVRRRDTTCLDGVTESHAQSRAVTRGHSVLCRAVPSRADPEETDLSVRPKKVARDGAVPSVVDEIFAHYVDGWRQAIGGPRPPVITQKRRKLASERLQEGFSAADLCRACDGLWASPFHMGDNDRSTRFTDFELVMRDAKHVEQFLAIAEENLPDPPPAPPLVSQPSASELPPDVLKAHRDRARDLAPNPTPQIDHSSLDDLIDPKPVQLPLEGRS